MDHDLQTTLCKHYAPTFSSSYQPEIANTDCFSVRTTYQLFFMYISNLVHVFKKNNESNDGMDATMDLGENKYTVPFCGIILKGHYPAEVTYQHKARVSAPK